MEERPAPDRERSSPTEPHELPETDYPAVDENVTAAVGELDPVSIWPSMNLTNVASSYAGKSPAS